jgi:uncharacterized protein (TIGR02118 family)
VSDAVRSTRRLTFLERRDDVTPERFSWHWSTDHADIARRLPGMTVYEQNHTVRQLAPATDGRAAFRVDGVAESWYVSAESITTGVRSDAKRELLLDEPLVFAGLTGIVVPPYAAPRAPAWKIWLLARGDGDGDSPTTADPFAAADDLRDATFTHRATRSQSVPTMTRETLRTKHPVPDLVAEIHFASAETAARAADELESRLSREKPAHVLDAFLTREVRIF